MRPEEFDHFIITDMGTAIGLQDDYRLVVYTLDPTKEKQTIEYNGIEILPVGVMGGRTPDFEHPENTPRPDIFDRNGKTAVFAVPGSKIVETPIWFNGYDFFKYCETTGSKVVKL